MILKLRIQEIKNAEGKKISVKISQMSNSNLKILGQTEMQVYRNNLFFSTEMDNYFNIEDY